MIAQRPATCKAWASPAVVSRRVRHAHVKQPTTVAKDSTKFQLEAENGDLSPAVAAGIFVAFKQGAMEASVEKLKYFMAVCILVQVGVDLLMRSEATHWDLSALAPAALAVNAVGLLSLGPAAIASFGTLLCTALEGVLNVNNSYWALLITLAMSIYYEVGPVWVCAAIALTYGRQFAVQFSDGNKVVGAALAATVASGFALFSYAKDQTMQSCNEVAIAFVMARCGWAAFKVARSVLKAKADTD